MVYPGAELAGGGRVWTVCVPVTAVAYFSNIAIVPLGLKDLGERVLGLSPAAVAQQMAVLALLTGVVALAVGFGMQQRGWGASLL